MFKAVDLFDEKTQKAINLGEKRDDLMKFFERLDFSSSKIINSGELPSVPVLDIKISKKNIQYINSVIQRSINQSKNVYTLGPFISIHDNDFVRDTKTKIVINGEKFDAKIKLHGVADDNWINAKKSYSIKTAKDSLISNTRRFKLIILEEQFIQTMMSYHLAHLMGYMDVGVDLVKVRFNGINQGYYLLEEALSKELLEKNKLSGVDLIKAHDEWTHQYRTGHLTLFTHEVANQEYKNYSKKNVGQLILFDKLMSAESYREVKDLVDIDRFAKHEAMRILFGSDQGVTGDNIKWLFDTSKGVFFPFFRMEGYLIDLPKSDLSFTFDKDLNDWFGFDYKIKVFPILNRNNEFRALRNKYLYKILSMRKEIEEYYSELYNSFMPLVSSDTTNNYSSRWYKYKTSASLSALSNNFDYIDKYLNYSKVYTTLTQINKKEFILNIVPDSNSILEMDTFKIDGVDNEDGLKVIKLDSNKKQNQPLTFGNFIKNERYSLSLDEDLEVKRNIYEYKIVTKDDLNIVDYNISFRNSITNKKVLDRETYKKIIHTPIKLNIKQRSFEEFLKKYPIRAANDKIIFNKGTYLITEDLIVPSTVNVHINPGVKIIMSPGVSIVIRGNLKISGSGDEYVEIVSSELGKPFGSFAALGSGGTTVDISFLKLTGGSEDNIAGVFLSGALSLYDHKKIRIKNSKIYSNHADDGINIKRSKVIVDNSEFYNNFSDQIDLDYSSGIVVDSSFYTDKNNKSSNSDGLDLSGSNIMIRDNVFSNFPDKGLSIGEESKVIVIKNTFNRNNSAVATKDGSKSFFFSNKYNSNKINLEMYQKKPIFRHPLSFNLNEKYDKKMVVKTPSSKYFKLKEKLNSELYNRIDISRSFGTLFDDLVSQSWVQYE